MVIGFGRVEGGGLGGEEAANWQLGYLPLPWLFRVLSPWPLHPHTLFIILTGNKIYGLSIVSEPAAAFHPPLPLPFAQLSPALWDLVKTKNHYRGESGLAQPTGNTQGHECKGLLCSAPLCLERHDNLTLPVLIALETLKTCT